MLIRAIDSVLGQTYENVECIVVNDNTVGDEHSLLLYEKIKVYKIDPRFRFIEQEKHINGAAARNAGIRVAKGEYIAFLDDDDYWEVEKLQLQVDVLKSLNESWGAVSCLSRRLKNDTMIRVGVPYRGGTLLMDILCRRIGLGTGAVLLRRNALDDVGYFDESLMRHQDLQLFAFLAAKYKIAVVEKYLYNIENRDTSNRPSVEKLKTIKQAYFKSIEPVMCELTELQRNWVYIMHDFECAAAFYREGYIAESLKMAVAVCKYPFTFYMAVERIIKRMLGRLLRNYYYRKFLATKAC
jgi:glycosyltransferase involved in cell wall biosynthesis